MSKQDLAEEDEEDQDFTAANETEENEADITLPDETEVHEEEDDLKRDLDESEQVSGPRTKRARND